MRNKFFALFSDGLKDLADSTQFENISGDSVSNLEI